MKTQNQNTEAGIITYDNPEVLPLYEGIIIRSHVVKDAESKARASQSLYGWEQETHPAAAWVEALGQGHTIQPSAFVADPTGKITHAKTFWKGTHFICADADNFKGQPDADDTSVDPWTDALGLSERYPALKDKVFAVSQSVSSMTDAKPHRRYRLIFLFDEMITSVDHYNQILLTLAKEYPVIGAASRSPAQPVFGNAREGYNDVAIPGNVLSLASDYPYIAPVEETPKPTHTRNDKHKTIDKSLDDFIREHNITTIKTRPKGGYFVKCPFSEQHASGKNGETDAYIWENPDKTYAFSGSHASCQQAGRTTWKAYREAVAPKPPESQRKAGRPSRAERAKDVEMPKEIDGKPVVALEKVVQIDDKPIINDISRDVVSDEVVKHLWGNGKPTEVYRRGKELGTLEKAKNRMEFTPADTDTISGIIIRKVALTRYGTEGYTKTIANPPAWLAADVLKNQPKDNVHQIKVILSHPFYFDGKIVSTRGYHKDSEVYLDMPADSHLDLDIQKHTVDDDIAIWRALLIDFPFVDNSDFENAIGYMLTLIIRQGLPVGEVSPLFNITAPREGIGKSLLADVLTAAVLGHRPATHTLGSSKEEIEKGIGAAMRSAPEMLLYDNVESKRQMDSGTLASVVTNPWRKFRVLGASEEIEYENKAVIVYTGSNVEMTPELAKRMVAIRLEDLGIPEKDRKVEKESILKFVIENQKVYLESLLRMVKRWIEAECPQAEETTHRMRHWSRVIQGIMNANGFGKDFLGNTSEIMLQSNPEFTMWEHAFRSIVEVLGDTAFTGWTVKDVFTILSFEKDVYAHEDDISDSKNFTRASRGAGILNELIGNKASDQARKTALAYLLRNKVGAVYAGYRLVDLHKKDGHTKNKLYALERLEGITDDMPEDNVDDLP